MKESFAWGMFYAYAMVNFLFLSFIRVTQFCLFAFEIFIFIIFANYIYIRSKLFLFEILELIFFFEEKNLKYLIEGFK